MELFAQEKLVTRIYKIYMVLDFEVNKSLQPMLHWAIVKVYYPWAQFKGLPPDFWGIQNGSFNKHKTTPSKALTPSFIFALTLSIQSQPQFVKMGKKTKKPGKGKEKTVKKTAKAEEKRARRESKKISPEDDIDAILVFIFEFL